MSDSVRSMNSKIDRQVLLISAVVLFFAAFPTTEGAIVPPPWANPQLNPCASQPRGWQLLFWPPDGKCYKIFQIGHPCPEGMELSPAPAKSGTQLSAECRCPPRTAQFAKDGQCYDLFTLGPCELGHYFGPDTDYKSNATSKRQWGACKQIKPCFEEDELFWVKDGKCYRKFTRGPCPKGQLLVDNPDRIATCKCNKHKELRDFRFDDGRCYQHFTRGPCWERGHLFLPNKTCGCHGLLPNYHEETGQCYELGTVGPCRRGELFQPHPAAPGGRCDCKPGHVRQAPPPSACYRPYTRGPCPADRLLLETGRCAPRPCQRGHLYVPAAESCHRIGSRGPCPAGRVVSFDLAVRPSVDGPAYDGVCACAAGAACSEGAWCGAGLARHAGRCYRLYARGACPPGAWLVPRGRGEAARAEADAVEGECECVPGHIRRVRTAGRVSVSECVSPVGAVAEFLNRNYTRDV